jgi:hypothetical protein
LVAATDVTAALLAKSDAPIYKRRYLTVDIAVEDLLERRPDGEMQTVRSVGARAVPPETLLYYIQKHAVSFFRDERGQTWPKVSFLKGVDRHAKLRPLAGIVTTPSVRPDGSFLTEPGYDAATQFVYMPEEGFALPPIREHPTRDDALRALEKLEGLFEASPFVSECDSTLAVAALMTAVCRLAFPRAPGVAVDAPTPGTGKSYVLDLFTTTILGRPAATIALTEDKTEMNKRIESDVIAGSPFIVLDNITGSIEGNLFAQLLTNRVKVRLFHTQDSPDCPWFGMLLVAGNGIVVVGDLTRRIFVIRLDARMERPEFKIFATESLNDLMRDRAQYVGAVLTIVRAFQCSGLRTRFTQTPMPFAEGEGHIDLLPLGSYKEWSRCIRAPLIWLGKCDLATLLENVVAADPVRLDFEELIAAWIAELEIEKEYTAGELIRLAYENTPEAVSQWSGLDWNPMRPRLRELFERKSQRGKLTARLLGEWLSQIKGRIIRIDEYEYTIMGRRDSHDKIMRWQARKVSE